MSNVKSFRKQQQIAAEANHYKQAMNTQSAAPPTPKAVTEIGVPEHLDSSWNAIVAGAGLGK